MLQDSQRAKETEREREREREREKGRGRAAGRRGGFGGRREGKTRETSGEKAISGGAIFQK